MKHRAYVLTGLAVLFAAAFVARADVKLHPMFSDNMVLQQGMKAPAWGTADPGEHGERPTPARR